MKKLFLLLTFGAFATYMAHAGLTPALTLHKTTKAVTVDGAIDPETEPWTDTWIPCAATKTANTTTGMTASFQLAYTNQAFWIATKQTGNSTVDTVYSADPWQRDCWEVFIGVDTTTNWGSGAYDNPKRGDYQFRMVRGNMALPAWPYTDATQDASTARGSETSPFSDGAGFYQNFGKHMKIAQIDEGATWIQEWQFSWKELAASITGGTWVPSYLKFEIQGADNTTGVQGGRTQQQFWRDPSDSEYNNTRTFSLLYLAEAPDTTVGPFLGVKPVEVEALTANVSNNVLTVSRSVNGTLYNISGQAVLKLRNQQSVSLANLPSGTATIR